MTLYRVTSIHYAPKDSESGLAYVINAPYESAVFRFLNRIMYGSWSEGDEENDAYLEVRALSEDDMARAKTWGLTITAQYGEFRLTGLKQNLVMWNRGEISDDTSDSYYGVTHYWWSAPIEVDAAAASTLAAVLAERFITIDADGKVVGTKETA